MRGNISQVNINYITVNNKVHKIMEPEPSTPINNNQVAPLMLVIVLI